MRDFQIFVPPHWQLIDLTEDVAGQVFTASLRLVLGMPVEVASRASRLVQRTMTSNLEEFAAAGAWAYLFPTDSFAVTGIHPSLLVQPFRPPEGTTPLEALVAIASSTAGATLLDTDRLVGLRTSSTEAIAIEPRDLVPVVDALMENERQGGPELGGIAPASRVAHRVRYVLGLPDQDASWVELLGSVQVTDDAEGIALASAILGLFDELALSFDWQEGRA